MEAGEATMPVTPGCGVLIVDDDAGLRALVAEVLGHAGYSVVEAESGEEALAAAARERPSLAILDVNMPGMSGYAVCRELRDRFGNDILIVFLSGVRTEAFDRVAGLLIGADDYLAKPFAPDELVARAEALLRRAPAAATNNGSLLKRLTPRELEVLRLLAEGNRAPQIAERLVISPRTVATHIEHILEKLGAHSRAEAVAVAYREDLFGSPA
jgi:DNA-binding NarL/FixJ family response regulator